jgi:hypothetical protein
MNAWATRAAGVAIVLITAGLAFGQGKPADCAQGRAPEKVEGQVVSVDVNAGKVTVREKDGTTHVLQGSKETLQNMKPGDQIEAKLREAPKC